jgi:pyrroline-5-carboxylate reductase
MTGFHAEYALLMAAQTARGTFPLLVESGNHPEGEVDKVTTPQGCTISGLNQMEHYVFSSSPIGAS